MDKERQFQKLLANPVEVEFKLKDEVFKAWMHCITDSQTLHCTAVYAEQYEMIIKDGGEEKYAKSMAGLAANCQTLVYALKKGQERTSEKVFSRVGELLVMPVDERTSLTLKYIETFDMTEEDLGNSLRARMVTSLPKSSSPAISQDNLSSEELPQSGLATSAKP